MDGKILTKTGRYDGDNFMECSKVAQEHVDAFLHKSSSRNEDLMSNLFVTAVEKDGFVSCVTLNPSMACTNKALFLMLWKKKLNFFKTQYGAIADDDYDDDDEDEDDGYDDVMTPVKGTSGKESNVSDENEQIPEKNSKHVGPDSAGGEVGLMAGKKSPLIDEKSEQKQDASSVTFQTQPNLPEKDAVALPGTAGAIAAINQPTKNLYLVK